MRAPLPVYIADPVRRLHAVTRAMQGLKQSKQALGAEVITRFNDFAPPTLLAQAARINFSTRLFNLVVTNVPGPQIPLYVLGRELEDIFPVGFLPPHQALFVAIMSYNGGINFGLLADYDSIDDLEVIAEGIERSIAELADAARRPRRSPSPRPRPADGWRRRAARIARPLRGRRSGSPSREDLRNRCPLAVRLMIRSTLSLSIRGPLAADQRRGARHLGGGHAGALEVGEVV